MNTMFGSLDIYDLLMAMAKAVTRHAFLVIFRSDRQQPEGAQEISVVLSGCGDNFCSVSPERGNCQDEREWLDGVVFSARKAHSFLGRGKKALRNELEAASAAPAPSSSAVASSQLVPGLPPVAVCKAKPEAAKESNTTKGAPTKKDPSDPTGLLKLFSQQRA